MFSGLILGSQLTGSTQGTMWGFRDSGLAACKGGALPAVPSLSSLGFLFCSTPFYFSASALLLN